MNIEDLYVKEISDEFGNLEELEAGSEEYCKTVDGITKLTEKLIELRKTDIEQQQMEDERKDRKVKNRLGIANIAVPASITSIGMILVLIYESKGTIFSGRVSGKIIDHVFRMK